MRGAVMICYPMGLPEWDPVRLGLEGSEDLAGTSVSMGSVGPSLQGAPRVHEIVPRGQGSAQGSQARAD